MGNPREAPYPNPHGPSERRLMSNVGHWAEGSMLGAMSALALVGALKPDLRWLARWSPRVAIGAGALLGSGILVGTLHHGGPRAYLSHEHQDVEHLRMAALIAAGGAIEAAVPDPKAGIGGAGALAAIGVIFLRHEQHGTGEALRQARAAHRRLGSALVATGAAKAADSVSAPGPWRLVWPLLGLGVALMLLGYREPTGAYEDPTG